MKNTIILLAICIASFTKSFSQINFTEVLPSPFVGVYESAIAFADVDGDGDQDFVETGLSDGQTFIANLYINDGKGVFTNVAAPFIGITQGAIAFADVDGDGDQDFLLTGSTASTRIAKLYLNDGTGTFSEIATPFSPVFDSAVAFADVDGDGDQDVLLSGDSSGGRILRLYLNNGIGIYTLSPNATFTGINSASLAVADIDNDGDQDFFITGITSNGFKSWLYLNSGDGTFTLVPNTTFIAIYNGDAGFADVDGDNDPDLLIAGSADGGSGYLTRLYMNNGNGEFTEASTTGLPDVGAGSFDFTDLDNDNDQDILITGIMTLNQGKISKIFINNGIYGFIEVYNLPFAAVQHGACAFQDVDGDSDMDAVITGTANGGGRIARLYKNESTLGVIDYSGHNKISLYPNPAMESINFKGITEEATVQIFDLTGKKLIDSKMDSNTTSLNISQLSQGIYLVKINDQFSGKLVKM